MTWLYVKTVNAKKQGQLRGSSGHLDFVLEFGICNSGSGICGFVLVSCEVASV